MDNFSDYKIEITTGQYTTATPEQKNMVEHLFGDNTAYKFELYFHWYNLIHELGHAVMQYHCLSRPHPVDEEQLVNHFAAAYWKHYGEIEKLDYLTSFVNETSHEQNCTNAVIMRI